MPSTDSGYIGDLTSMSGIKGRRGLGLKMQRGGATLASGDTLNQAVPANPSRVYLTITNVGSYYGLLSLGRDCGNCFYLWPTQSITFDKDHPWTGDVSLTGGDGQTIFVYCEASLAGAL